jgi:hypothetical protein
VNENDDQLDTDLALILDGHLPALLAQQSDESALAYEAFLRYLGMGTCRSMRRVARDGGHDAHYTGRWASTYHWRSRAAYYDKLLLRA